MFHPWRSLRTLTHVVVVWARPHPAAPAATDGATVIWLDPRMTQAERRCALTHELVLLAAATGMRPSEWRGLTADRIDLQARTILVDRQATDTGRGTAPLKTAASRRTITVGAQTAEVLTRLVAGADHEGRLFHTDGTPWTRDRLSKVWTVCRRRLPWMGPGGWHQLRHHHANVLLSSGASVVAVARRLGHKDATETLATYAHVMPSDDGALAELTDGLVR
ncbi:site-specific integrase [Micrococcus porci]|uniref:site-specific integrase n=1 Tax=Micrococcus porci TaxID=2856555 RepID=UPI003CEF8761